MQIIVLTALTMIAFAANSVLARLALGNDHIAAADYSLIRLAFGAAMLALLLKGRHALRLSQLLSAGGNWLSAVSLLVYVVGFSYAYLALDTGLGALVLFACVQATMIGWSIAHGHRPVKLEWLGLTIAFSAFVFLVLPGSNSPDPVGTMLMIAAGIAWGAYSLRGAGSENALADTTGNFVRATLLIIPFVVVLSLWRSGTFTTIEAGQFTAYGLVLAAVSGALTSGIGYALWYRCLPHISSTKAAIVQLSVPAIATLGGTVFVSETVTVRLIVCSICILGGVAIAISARSKT